MTNYLLPILFVLAFILNATGQQNLEDQIAKEPVFTEDFVDETYGITHYEPLNLALNGDSVRMKRGYAVNGWIEDFYTNGKMIHRGYYVEGQLKIYKNFYPNGAIEREFTNIDNFRAKLTVYYDDGTIKSQVKYVEGSPKLWIDYYPNGKMKYYEEYNKRLMYHVAKRFYYEDETPSSLMELTHKRKLNYSFNEYYPGGGKKTKGNLIYNKDTYDYQRIGTWVYYNADGSQNREEKYVDGKVK